MGVRRSSLIFVVLLTPAVSHAGHHNFSVFIAPSVVTNPDEEAVMTSVWNGGLSARRAGSIGNGVGWHVGGEISLKRNEGNQKRPTNWSVIADASAHLVGRDDKGDATQITVMVGPRFSLPDVPKLHAFAHVLLLGATHVSDKKLSISASTLATTVGVGVDIMPKDHRVSPAAIDFGHQGIRIQADRIIPWDGSSKSWRISVGYVYTFSE